MDQRALDPFLPENKNEAKHGQIDACYDQEGSHGAHERCEGKGCGKTEIDENQQKNE